MVAFSVSPPYPLFFDSSGTPLEDGYIYIGEAGLNAELNPIQVYFDADLTIPAQQPIRTLAGYPSNNGNATRMFCESENYSIITRNKTGELIHSAIDVTDIPLVSTITTIAQSSFLPVENYIINGRFDIWQREITQTGTGYGSDDRWLNNNVGTTKTHTRQSFTDGQDEVEGSPIYYSRTVVSSVVGASNYCNKEHRIEGLEKLSAKTGILSFYAKADIIRNIGIEFGQNFGSGGSTTVTYTPTVVQITSTWTKYTVPINLSSVAGKTIGADNYTFLKIWFDAGSNYAINSGVIGQQSGTFDIACVKIEPGSTATEFLPTDLAIEMQRCLRFYEKSYDMDIFAGDPGEYEGEHGQGNGNGGPQYPYWNCHYKVRKRSTPAITAYSPATGVVNKHASGGGFDCDAWITDIGLDGFRIRPDTCTPSAYKLSSVHFLADSEI